jgi:hypothetical protein
MPTGRIACFLSQKSAILPIAGDGKTFDRVERIHLSEGVFTMSEPNTHTEEFSVNGDEILAKVKQLLHEGNVRRVIIKDKTGRILVEFPLTVGVVGAALAPVLVAVGAVAALVSEATIVVEKAE